jgi:hypothetical protein
VETARVDEVEVGEVDDERADALADRGVERGLEGLDCVDVDLPVHGDAGRVAQSGFIDPERSR